MTAEKKAKRQGLWKDNAGSMTIFIMVIMFAIISITFVLEEVLRMHNIAYDLEMKLQRAVNVAVEECMSDSWRQDGINVLDAADAQARFYFYLRNDVGLDSNHRMVKDGGLVYTLTFSSVDVSENPAYMEIHGEASVPSIFPFLSGDIIISVRIKSKSIRLD